jgi:uncharacterized protein (TIGR00730 family)
MKSIAVFLSSSTTVAPVFSEIASLAGQAIARQGWTLVYGGNAVGPMKSLADAARLAGGKVIGITPQVFVDMGVADHLCDELVVVDSMRQRKQLLEQKSDAFLTLPGGVGTLEEFIEILVGKQLKYHHKPIVMLDHMDVWKPLNDYLNRGIELGFVRKQTPDDFQIVHDLDAAIRYLQEKLA